MQGSGRVLVASARRSIIRLSRHTTVHTIYSRPPPSLTLGSVGVQRRGYRQSAVVLKEDDDKRHKSGKDIEGKEKSSPEGHENGKKIGDSPETEQDAKTVEKTESAKDKTVEPETSSVKEKRTREPKNKAHEETVRPAVMSRHQNLSVVANNGNKSRLIITNPVHPEIYPQCMALAMSGRPILPGFYSTSDPYRS
jgi:hypothetical protein